MKEEVIVHSDSKSPISETFRTLRTNIQFINNKEKVQTILVTSTLPREGKSFVSANLAVVFAQVDKKVLLIDADMRKGRQYGIFELSPKPGLSNYLLDSSEKDVDIKEYIQKTEVENVSVMVAGSIPPNPSELLVSDNMIKTLNKLKEEYDIIILDGPPVEMVTDSVILTRIVDTSIIVASSNETKKDNLHKVIASIQNVEGKIAGIVVNKMRVTAKEYKKGYYYGNDKK